jgi:hypothetical protein
MSYATLRKHVELKLAAGSGGQSTCRSSDKGLVSGEIDTVGVQA